MPGLSAYIASTQGVTGLTKSVGLEYAARNIRINGGLGSEPPTDDVAGSLRRDERAAATAVT